ncbi:nuclear transport factor 2 family protein [Chryseomicrobium palamuruense]|uniref:Nuclear transport factor 2 family protein n=1 Tax=Chryseomicrobium palamuruense TaxID=682973 RepID=A0ABV8UQT7_9BACL
MKKRVGWLVGLLIVLLLSACAGEEQAANENSTADLVPQGKQAIETHAAESTNEEQQVGFEIAGGVIEEAQNVPEQEKQQIVQAFEQYIEAFNHENIDDYMARISENPKGFDYEAEKEFVQETFEEYDTKRTPSDVTIIKYDEQEAQVFANLEIELEQHSTGGKVTTNGRQVTVFTKEDNNWLVTSVYFIRD